MPHSTARYPGCLMSLLCSMVVVLHNLVLDRLVPRRERDLLPRPRRLAFSSDSSCNTGQRSTDWYPAKNNQFRSHDFRLPLVMRTPYHVKAAPGFHTTYLTGRVQYSLNVIVIIILVVTSLSSKRRAAVGATLKNGHVQTPAEWTWRSALHSSLKEVLHLQRSYDV